MFDVFYIGKKPDLFAHEQECDSVEDARTRTRTRYFWLTNYLTDYTGFDFLWEPVPWQENFIHCWPSQWQPDSGTYLIPQQEDQGRHYNSNFTLTRTAAPELFVTPENIDADSFDYSWHPDPSEPAYTYHFGTQWQAAGGPVYPGNNEIKIIDGPRAQALPVKSHNWQIPEYFNPETVDYSWHPNPLEPALNYHFAVKWGWHNNGGVEYRMPGAVDTKYLDTVIAETKGNKDYWHIPANIDPNSIDYTWCPDPTDPPLNYHFAVAWGWLRTGGPEYRVPGAVDVKFVEDFTARTHSDLSCWRIPENIDRESFDFSWAPHPNDPAYIYKFPTVWNSEGGPEYHVPGATEEKYIDQQTARTVPNKELWTVPEEIDETLVDFSWVPHPKDPPYIYHFASEYQTSAGLTYTVPGAREIKFAGDIPVKNNNSAVKALDIFYLDRSNSASDRRFEELKARYPTIQKIRYVNSAMDTVKRCVTKTKTSRFWVIGSLNDYTNFDFAWHPAPWQSQMTHVFGTQWNKWSDTFLINRWEFERNSKWAKGIEEFPNLNFVADQQVVAPADASDIYVIDFANEQAELTINYLKERYRVVKTARFFDNYLDTLKRIIKDVPDTQEHIWVVASICDYTQFDFSWQPEAWQSQMIHVFPSNEQKFGDTFYINVQSFKEQMNNIELLDWFDTINYSTEQTVDRWPLPVIIYNHDSQIPAVINSNFSAPLAVFTKDNQLPKQLPTVSVWREKNRTIIPLNKDASTAIIPKSAIAKIQKQIYDYPYIDKTQRDCAPSQLQDIVFISYDEPEADRNYAQLLESYPRAKRVHGVKGMENALAAAARASETPWYFAVFGKTELHPDFDFDFRPDYFQQPKHYIFYSINRVNKLVYGEMAVIMYNCNLILDNVGCEFGLDYTMSFPHEVIPIVSTYGNFNTSPYHTWRTAFREVSKLYDIQAREPSVETEYRINVWETVAEGDYAEWALKGAKDGSEFYTNYQDDFAYRKNSFNWEWLRNYFKERYGDIN